METCWWINIRVKLERGLHVLLIFYSIGIHLMIFKYFDENVVPMWHKISYYRFNAMHFIEMSCTGIGYTLLIDYAPQ